MELALADKIARSSLEGVVDVVEEAKKALGFTDEHLSFIRPTVVASAYHDLASDYIAIALISTMARIKGKKLQLSIVSDGEESIIIPVSK